MQNKFNVSEEEKNRIRLLHETESRDRRLSSVLNEQEKIDNNFDDPMEVVEPSTGLEPQAKVVANGRICVLRKCTGSYSHGNFCVPNTSIQKGDVFTITQNYFPNNVGQTYFVRSVGGNCSPYSNGTLTQISSLNSQGCPRCCNNNSVGWQSFTPGGWCWNNGNGPSAFPCGGASTYSCNGSTCNPAGSVGQYTSMAACEADCPPPMKYSCKPPYGTNGCIQDVAGTYTTMQDCEEACEPDLTYDCGVQGSCVPVQGGGGQYWTMADCVEECRYEGNWRCKSFDQEPQLMTRPEGGGRKLNEQGGGIPTSGHHCIKSLNGPFTSKFDCEQECPGTGVGKTNCINCVAGTMTNSAPGQKECPPGFSPITNLSVGPCTECQQSGCVNVGWGFGQGLFNSMTECQASNCQTSTEHECVNGACVQQNGGQFADMAACQASGCGGQLLWECDNGPNGCTQTATGTFQSQGQCETACCQDVINNWGWAQGNQTNPCQKFYNLFGAMGSTNPSTLPFNEECIYNYLLNLILNLGGPCVQGNFINLLDSFMGLNGQGTGQNQCYGNPNSGGVQGSPALNSVCGKMDQFCSASPMTPSKFFKCQYAIDFANQNGCNC